MTVLCHLSGDNRDSWRGTQGVRRLGHKFEALDSEPICCAGSMTQGEGGRRDLADCVVKFFDDACYAVGKRGRSPAWQAPVLWSST